MRIHVLGVPHTQTTEAFTTCAFTMKVWNLCRMLTRRGHEVFHYGVEGSNPECTEHVSVATAAEWEAIYPHPGTAFYNHDRDDAPARRYKALWAARCKASLLERTGAPHTEILALTWGDCQRTACDGIAQFAVESGIGYPNSWAAFRVYESYAWMHMHLGRDGGFGGERWYWAVIPNAFDVSKFDFNPKRGDDFLYLGRLHREKGIHEAIRAAKVVGRKITIVGQGNPEPFLRGNPHASYLPPVGIEGRRKLLSECKAVFCPTLFVEPFCGVNVEAQLSGAPVITTDWGAFAETVLHGKTGYRVRSFEQMVWAARNVDRIDPAHCHQWAKDNYSLERVALMYEEFFQQVLNIRGNRAPLLDHNGCVRGIDTPDPIAPLDGFYLPFEGRTQLDWLERCYNLDDREPELTRAHEGPGVAAPPAPSENEWIEAQAWERSWWGLVPGPHWEDEKRKQDLYARLMGFPADMNFGQKTILDVGCGPISLLQRTKHGPSRGVDPLAVSEETRARYIAHGVEFLNVKAESMPRDQIFDEVWMYNCLQHTEDPAAILEHIIALGRSVRIFEWIDIPEKHVGHPQLLSEGVFRAAFGGDDYERLVWDVGTHTDLDGGSTRYIAIHAVKKNPASALAAAAQ